MQTIEVTGPSLQINSGILELSEAQVHDRRHALVPTEQANQFKLTKSVCFKRGEVFGYEGPPLGKAALLNAEVEGETLVQDSEPEKSAKELALLEIDPDQPVPVALLKHALEQETIKATCTLLEKKYGVKVSKGSDTVPPDIFARIAKDCDFEFEEVPDNE